MEERVFLIALGGRPDILMEHQRRWKQQSNHLPQGGEEGSEWWSSSDHKAPPPHAPLVSSPLKDIEDTDGQVTERKNQQNHH